MRGLIANIIVSVVAAAVGFQLYQSVYPESRVPKMNAAAEQKEENSDPVGKVSRRESIHFSNYKAIGEKNLFRPERREWVPPKKAALPEKPSLLEQKPKTPPPPLTLFGTIIFGDDVRIAIIKGPAGRGKSGMVQKNYRLGDEISGYSVTGISEDRVTLAKGEDIIELKLREGKTAPAISAVRRPSSQKARRQTSAPRGRTPQRNVKKGKEPDRIVVKGPGGREIIKRKKVIRTPFGSKTIYIEER